MIRFGMLLLGVSLAFVTGCGGASNSHPFAPVTGIVTLDGKPIEGATVTFSAKKKGGMSLGVTNADGRFTLKSPTGKSGAPVGDNDVTVSLSMDVGGQAAPAAKPDDLAPATSAELGQDSAVDEVNKAKTTKWIVPERYSKIGVLTALVPAGGLRDHKLELQSP